MLFIWISRPPWHDLRNRRPLLPPKIWVSNFRFILIFNRLLSSIDSFTSALTVSINESSLASKLDDEVEACGSSSLTILVSCFYLFLLDVVKFTSTSVASSIMSSKEINLLSLSNRANSLLKASA